MGKPVQWPRELLGLKNEDIITSSSTGRASTMAIVVHHIELGPSQGPILQELVNFLFGSTVPSQTIHAGRLPRKRMGE